MVTIVVGGCEVRSRERGTCDCCNRAGFVGDFPGQGGIVAAPQVGGWLLCDDCADDIDLDRRGARERLERLCEVKSARSVAARKGWRTRRTATKD